jgi:3-phenylpropionate/cinnamic acid dioxygenase small subunit
MTDTQIKPLPVDQIFPIHGFMLNEAELLDDRRWDDWLALLTDDFDYLLPMPVTRDNPAIPGYDETAYLMAENRFTLDAWVERLSPQHIESAWSENPPARIRHFVTNIRPQATAVEGEVRVRSNVLVSVARGNDEPILFASERRVYLDQNLPSWPMRLII